MDLKTGKMYESKEEALTAGVPESDIAELYSGSRDALLAALKDCPMVKFSSGPFKEREYKRMENGQLVRAK